MNSICFTGEISDRGKKVCSIICSDGPIRFTRLKEKSHMHQEILSRTLKRISDDCNIYKSEEGYNCKMVNK